MDFTAFTSAIQLAREALSLLKDIASGIPKREDKVAVEERLQQAENAFRTAEAEAAKGLGYQLCRCTWPPQIMLSKGFHEYNEVFECPKCGNRFPPVMPDLSDDWRGAP